MGWGTTMHPHTFLIIIYHFLVNINITTYCNHWIRIYRKLYHQQYLHKNPMGYCGLGGTGVSCPVGVGVPTD